MSNDLSVNMRRADLDRAAAQRRSTEHPVPLPDLKQRRKENLMTDTDTRTEYGVRYANGSEGWGYTEEYTRILAEQAPGHVLIQRTVTYGPVTVVPDPLPTVPGSVIEATVDGREGLLLGMTDDSDDYPWFVMKGRAIGEFFRPSDLSNVVVKYDAGADK